MEPRVFYPLCLIEILKAHHREPVAILKLGTGKFWLIHFIIQTMSTKKLSLIFLDFKVWAVLLSPNV